MPVRRSAFPLVGVGALFLLCIGLELRFTYDSIDEGLHITEYARSPFSVTNPAGTLNGVQPEAKEAGLAEGDRPVTIEGRPVRGLADVIAAVRGRRAGDVIHVTVNRDGTAVSAPIRLAPLSSKPLSPRDWVLTSFLNYLTPWFCILLGFGVTFLRPRDPLAWLLLLLLLSFSFVAQGQNFASVAASWEPGIRSVALFYHAFLSGTWGLWMMLFGQYFPDRIANGFWDRLARWVLGVPIGIFTILAAITSVAALEDATAMAPLQRGLNRLGFVLMLLMMTAIGTFFINIFVKIAHSKTSDSRRRLKLLYTGASVSLTPLFLLVLATLIMGKSLTRVPDGILIPALMLLFVFPLTLAYVIVVEKAMELRVLVRVGLQYALASKGMRVLQVIASVVVIFFAIRMTADATLRQPQRMELLGFTLVFIVYSRRLAPKVQGWIDRRFFREAVNIDNVLAELSEKVRTIREIRPLLGTVTSTISSALHVPHVAALLPQNGDYVPAFALGYDTAPSVSFSRRGAVAERMERDPKPLRVSKVEGDEDLARLKDLDAELLLPLAVKDRLLGFLSLGPKRSEEPYSAADLRLLESLAGQTGLAIENSRLTEAVASEVAQRERLNRELEIAREVQQRLFPQAGPQVAGLEYTENAGLPRASEATITISYRCAMEGWALRSAISPARVSQPRC